MALFISLSARCCTISLALHLPGSGCSVISASVKPSRLRTTSSYPALYCAMSACLSSVVIRLLLNRSAAVGRNTCGLAKGGRRVAHAPHCKYHKRAPLWKSRSIETMREGAGKSLGRGRCTLPGGTDTVEENIFLEFSRTVRYSSKCPWGRSSALGGASRRVRRPRRFYR